MLMVFLYVARARAHRTEASSAQLGIHFYLVGTRRVTSPRKAIKVRRRQGRPLPLGLKYGLVLTAAHTTKCALGLVASLNLERLELEKRGVHNSPLQVLSHF